MFLTKDAKSPFYKLVYFDKAGIRRKVSTKETTHRKATVFMHNFTPDDTCVSAMAESTENITQIEPYGRDIKTIETFRDEYIELMKPSRSLHYIRSIKMSFKQLLEETGNLAITELDKKTLELFISKTYARTQKGAAHVYKTLKAAFTKAEEWEYIPYNPFKKFKLPKLAETLPVFITFDELQKIIENEPRQDLQDIYLFAYYTGMRRAELIHLSWNSVDMERRIIKVSNENGFVTKSKKERIIPVCNPLMNIIEKLHQSKKEGAVYVFETARGVIYHDETMGRNFKKAVLAAGLSERIHFHTLRHSFASALVQDGASIYVVRDLLGHADIKTTMIYSHLKEENLIQAVTTFDRVYNQTA